MQSTFAKTLVDNQCGLKFIRSPKWVGERLLFLDMHDRCIKSANLQGEVNVVHVLNYWPGSFSVMANADLVVSDAWSRKMYRLQMCGDEVVADRQIADLSGFIDCCIGDSISDNRGGLYVCDVGFDYLDPMADPQPNGIIVHIEKGGHTTVVARNLFFPGGMAITANQQVLLVAETLGHRLCAFDIADDGTFRNRREWAGFSDDIYPAGICLDSEDAVWMSGASTQVYRVTEGGQIDREIVTEKPSFAVVLGGPRRDKLFICTSASSDPIITSRAANATIDVVEVDVPG